MKDLIWYSKRSTWQINLTFFERFIFNTTQMVSLLNNEYNKKSAFATYSRFVNIERVKSLIKSFPKSIY